ncbi:hypothetical protein K491DRAFT_687003 [Lophiostoma macrostomum CBS 122681]|uniref:Uncharacterized protein n=1 Tax=Lophiostoma macrostomum CBS 122681 TaxID=1314788 RepID=A0A6A6TQE9_9PLEO|nr:hypothetical protein K491DRAFT_687003 [Lophiostoma macrostomum CBS 122681]
MPRDIAKDNVKNQIPANNELCRDTISTHTLISADTRRLDIIPTWSYDLDSAHATLEALEPSRSSHALQSTRI